MSSLRTRVATVMALAVAAPTLALVAWEGPADAAAPAPVILNAGTQNGADAQWQETQGMPDDGGQKTFFFTFLVQHAPGRTITSVRLDQDFNGTDNASTAPTVAVTGQQLVQPAGPGAVVSRVTGAIGITGKPGGFSCPFIGGATRVVDGPVRMRVQDSTSEQSATVNGVVKFTEDSNCSARADYPRLLSSGQNVTDVVPGQEVTYSFSCDDVDGDVLSSDDNCERARIRWRRLNDGAVSGTTLKTGMNDNTTATFAMSFPERGVYVVEAQLGNEDGGFPQTGGTSQGWNRLGNAVVNDPATSLSGAIAFAGVQPSSPPSVNPGASVTAQATGLADDGGVVQAIDWDADGNGAYERSELNPPANVGGNVVQSQVSGTQLTQGVSTATPGLKTVTARLTDNGAFDAADAIRRQRTISGQLRVNAVPTTSNVGVTTAEDTAVNVGLAGVDSDAQPAPLRYLIVTPPNPAHGTLSPVSGNTVTFTPAPNYHGAASFTYRVDDGDATTVGAHALSNVSTASITVTSVNDLPFVDGTAAETAEDTPVDVTMSGDDVEDGSALTYTVASQPTNGTASCTSAGVCTYTPELDFNGTDTYIVEGEDSDGGTATATVTVTVSAVNDAPVANAQTVVVPEDAVNFPINLTAGDVDDVVLGYTAPITDVAHGSVTCFDDACTYTPDADYTGSDSFTFTVSDGELTDTETVTIDVSAVNDAPVATDVLDAVTDEDVPVDVTATGTDIEGDPLTATSVTDPANGTASVTAPDTVTYVGDADFHGTDTFDFTVEDPDGLSDTGTVVVTVNPVNDAPVVADQSFTVAEDTPAFLSIAAGDVDGDLLGWSIDAQPGDGLVVGTGPDVVFVPDYDANGTQTFTVSVSDGNGGTDSATITVVVDPVNDAPVADLGTAVTDEDTPVGFQLAVSDVDGDALTTTAPVDGPTNGTVACTGIDCTYTPDADFHGSDLLTFSVEDGNGGTDSASVTIAVAAVNDAPVAGDATATTAEDAAVAIPLAAEDVDGDVLTYEYTSPGQGTVQGFGPDAVYVPNPNSSGADSFSFTVTDGDGAGDTGTVDVTIEAVNDAPIAIGGSASTPEDTSVGFQLGATDVEGDALSFLVTSPPGGGTLTCDGSGACTFEPAPDTSGELQVGYAVSDGSLSSNGLFTIIVGSENDAPTASDTTVATAEDQALAITLSAADVDGDPLSYSIASPPASGSAVCSDSGSCTYTPAPNSNGSDSLTWTASDGSASVTRTVTILVGAVNDAPQALDLAVTTDEGTPTTFTLPASDAEGDALTYSVDLPASHGTVTLAGSSATYTPAAGYDGTDLFTFRATDPSGAFTTGRVTVVVEDVPYHATKIDPEVTTAKLVPTGPLTFRWLVVFPKLQATLTTAAGAPVVGRTLTFTVGSYALCTGVTDGNGTATCSAPAGTTALGGLLNLGYTVAFAGDVNHAPSTARGGIVQVGALKL